MIKVKYTSSVERITEITPKNTTVYDFLEEHGGIPMGATLSMNGVPFGSTDELYYTFDELTNGADNCILYALVKTDQN